MTSATIPRYEGDPERLKNALSYFPSGVVSLLAQIDGEPTGMIASAFTVGVSFDPPLVSCAIQNSSTTWAKLRRSNRIGVSVLAETQAALARQIASRNRVGRFTDVILRDVGSDALFIAGAPVWLECEPAGEFPAGDHTVALLKVVALGADPDIAPLVFHASGFRQLTKQPT